MFDHNVPHKLRHLLASHEVTTADEMLWSELENGDLLAAAETDNFALMVTADKTSPTSKTSRIEHLRLLY